MAEKAWGGVFDQSTDRRVEEFTESVSFDRRLYAQDIEASVAHAQMLAKVGLLTEDECRQIEQTLGDIRREIEQGQFPFSSELEDIHMHIERALIDRLGDIGRKLHTGRSRNDQVSTDLRLWVRQAIDQIDQRLVELQRAFVGRCDGDLDVILPGYTHTQRAQPVLAPHYWLAYCEKFQRDRGRLADCRRRANVLPLGTAALAGTSLPIDRDDVARRLGFDGLAANSLDASSDRDFVLELAFALALIAEHLQHLGRGVDPLVHGGIRFPQAPAGLLHRLVDHAAEGQSGRAGVDPRQDGPGDRQFETLLVLVKGLPLAYNRDLQEDKPPLFDSFDTVRASLELAAALVAGVELNRPAIAERLDRGHAGRDGADGALDSAGGFRSGRPTGWSAGWCARPWTAACGWPTCRWTISARPTPGWTRTCTRCSGVERAVAAMTSYGSTGPEQVKQQIARWKAAAGRRRRRTTGATP